MSQNRSKKADVDFSISVIMPAYNVAEYIGDAIDSVLSQTLLPDELIIVNDGSTDATRDVISRYEHHSIIRVVDKKNGGLGPARNTGIENARAKYLYFFDSDDILHSGFVESMSQISLENNGPDIIMFSGESFFEKGLVDVFRPPEYKRNINSSFESGMKLYWQLSKKNSLYASTCLYVTRRKLWYENGLKFKDIIHEDEDVLFPLLISAGVCYCSSDVFFFRRVRCGSIMSSGFSSKNLSGFNVAINTMLQLKFDEPDKVAKFNKCWRHRMRSLVTRGFRRSVHIGRLRPSGVMMRGFVSVFSLEILFSVLKSYLFYFKSNLSRKKVQ